jgi:PAS domain S-box-containing protein
MRLRVILLVLSLLAFFSAAVAGYQYYVSSEKAAFKAADRKALLQAEALRNRIASFLFENMKTVKVLAGLEEMATALSKKSHQGIGAADDILDHMNNVLRTDVSYLIDRNGVTIASSNRHQTDSFVGKNYAFRPYFKDAIDGLPSIYMALGVTSGKRGVYYSCPVYGNNNDQPTGVAVIKTAIDPLEKEFSGTYEGVVLLTDPNGIIFMSNRKDFILNLLWKLPPPKTSEIAKTLQFGSGPWNWTGLLREDQNHAVDRSGKKYLIRETEMENYPGWHIVFLQSLKSISQQVSNPLLKTTFPIIFILCVLVGLSVFYLYRRASHDIVRRKAAEDALKESEETALALLNAPTESALLLNTSGTILALNVTAANALGKPMNELLGQNVFEQFSHDIKKSRERYHKEVLKTGKPVRYEDKRQEKWRDTHLYPVLDAQKKVVRVAIFSRDITERKEAEQALKQARDDLHQYSRDLELKVRERTEEITGILENTPAVVFVKDSHLRYLFVNTRFEELFGIKKDTIRGQTDEMIFPEKVAQGLRESHLKALRGKRSFQVEEQIPHTDGLHTYLLVIFPIYDEYGSVQRLCGIATDITELKEAQDRLRRLSARIMDGQEEERAAVARELHDELGQMLTALRMESVWLKNHLQTADPGAGERASAMSGLIDKSIDEVRGMAVRLRPKVLDDLGIIDALEWYTTEFERRSGIAAIFKHRNVPPIDRMLSTAFYRIAQEALTNIARHSHATQVDIVLEMEEELVTLSVMDNGCGFDVSRGVKSEGLGIAGMRERALLAGGKLHIQSRTGEGTHIIFTVSNQGEKEQVNDQDTVG